MRNTAINCRADRCPGVVKRRSAAGGGIDCLRQNANVASNELRATSTHRPPDLGAAETMTAHGPPHADFLRLALSSRVPDIPDVPKRSRSVASRRRNELGAQRTDSCSAWNGRRFGKWESGQSHFSPPSPPLRHFGNALVTILREQSSGLSGTRATIFREQGADTSGTGLARDS
jgi:hypothetical protein